jgi:hypothetical protein
LQVFRGFLFPPPAFLFFNIIYRKSAIPFNPTTPHTHTHWVESDITRAWSYLKRRRNSIYRLQDRHRLPLSLTYFFWEPAIAGAEVSDQNWWLHGHHHWISQSLYLNTPFSPPLVTTSCISFNSHIHSSSIFHTHSF